MPRSKQKLSIPGKRIAIAAIGAVEVPIYAVESAKLAEMLDGNIVWGAYSPTKNVIVVDENLPPTLALVVIVHELAHAGFNLLPARGRLSEEMACDVVSQVVAQNFDVIAKAAAFFA